MSDRIPKTRHAALERMIKLLLDNEFTGLEIMVIFNTPKDVLKRKIEKEYEHMSGGHNEKEN